MRTSKKTARTAKVEGRSWKQNLFTFLRNYRATPHSVTHQAPATLLFNRAINVKLPQSQTVAPADPNHQQALDASCKSRQKNKVYFDKRNKAQSSEFKVGDAVLLRNSKKGKLQTPYEHQKYQIVKKKGSMIKASNDNRQVTLGPHHILKSLKKRKVKQITQEINKNSRATRTPMNARKGKQNHQPTLAINSQISKTFIMYFNCLRSHHK
ncbi:Hypothetical predicted protein [Paramuricea clavata]|uniref:Uncharacterized protein n=1 Tax=Paramuricea clavata TaxID=317549 RepID=A0A6S7IWA4_PARCT|nr:Hypothetical predicted protein [Paramuricea clavata]